MDHVEGGWVRKKAMHRHTVSPRRVLLLVFFDLFKVSKIKFGLLNVSKITTKSADLFKVRGHPRSSHPKSCDLFKVSKMAILGMTCSKVDLNNYLVIACGFRIS